METTVERTLRHLQLILARSDDLDALNIRTEDGAWVAASQTIREAVALMTPLVPKQNKEELLWSSIGINSVWMQGWNAFCLGQSLPKDCVIDFQEGYDSVYQWVKVGHGLPLAFVIYKPSIYYMQGFRRPDAGNHYADNEDQGGQFELGQRCRRQYNYFHKENR